MGEDNYYGFFLPFLGRHSEKKPVVEFPFYNGSRFAVA